MIGGTVINVEILVGLPGSGKTYYTEEKKNEYLSGCRCDRLKRQVYPTILDFDKYKGKYPELSSILCYTYNEIFLYNSESLSICDGLFLTNEQQEKLVKEWVDLFNEEGGKNKSNKLNIKFVYFKENREGCLTNDSYREKERRADITIKHSPFEKPNIETIKEKFNQGNINFEIEEKEVYIMSKYEGIFKKLRNDYWSEKLGKDVMVSENWGTGGTWYDCWGNGGKIGPDKVPESFKEFDDLLAKYCPDVTFLRYKSIYNNCVTVEEDYESDYYGGTEYFNLYCCDLKKLYEMLTEFGYLKD